MNLRYQLEIYRAKERIDGSCLMQLQLGQDRLIILENLVLLDSHTFVRIAANLALEGKIYG